MSQTDSWNSASVWERGETVRETGNAPLDPQPDRWIEV